MLSGSGCIQENLYDGEGLRAGLSEHGKRSTFIFAGGEIVAELDHGGSASRYIRGYGAAALEREGSYYGIHQDEQLSTGWITGADGKIENGYEYDAFGNLLRNSTTVPNRILYGGQQYDSETGQYYLRARYYNPVVGRFLQEDSYHGDGLNLYAYCSNNPVTYYDPSGYGREHNSRAKENVKKENVTVRQGENGSEGGRGSRFPENPDDLFPENYVGLEKEVKPDGKINYTVQAGDKTYKIEYHPQHEGDGHYNGDHYHVLKLGDYPKPGKTKPPYFRIPNLDPDTPAQGGTFAPGDLLPTKNKNNLGE